MGIVADLYKKGTYCDTPYNNYFEVSARDIDKQVVHMSKFKHKICIVVNISPFSSEFKNELETLINLKKKYGKELEVLLFPSSQIDKINKSDEELKNDLFKEIEKSEIDVKELNLFNRVYVNGVETSEVYKYCLRNSNLFRLREGKSLSLKKNFSKFLVSKNGKISHLSVPSSDREKNESENLEYLIDVLKSEIPKEITLRNNYISYEKFI